MIRLYHWIRSFFQLISAPLGFIGHHIQEHHKQFPVPLYVCRPATWKKYETFVIWTIHIYLQCPLLSQLLLGSSNQPWLSQLKDSWRCQYQCVFPPTFGTAGGECISSAPARRHKVQTQTLTVCGWNITLHPTDILLIMGDNIKPWCSGPAHWGLLLKWAGKWWRPPNRHPCWRQNEQRHVVFFKSSEALSDSESVSPQCSIQFSYPWVQGYIHIRGCQCNHIVFRLMNHSFPVDYIPMPAELFWVWNSQKTMASIGGRELITGFSVQRKLSQLACSGLGR